MLLAAASQVFGAAPAAEPFEAFLASHCNRCHSGDKSEGELRIDKLSRDFRTGADTHRWAEVLDRINAGEMPPEPEQRPTEAEISAFVAAIDSRIREGRAVRMAARPPVALYRLSRKEYKNTVHDLLGVHYDPAETGGLNADTRWHGYERIGSELTLSPSHVDRYYRAAERVLDRAFPAAKSESKKIRKTAAEMHYSGGKTQQELLARFGTQQRPLRWVRFPGSAYNFIAPHLMGRFESGFYRVRIQASGLRPAGSPPAHLRIGVKTDEESVDPLFEFDVTAPEDQPEVYEAAVLLEMPQHQYLNAEVVSTNVIDRRRGRALRAALESRDHIFTHSSETLLRKPAAPQLFDDKGNPLFHCVLVDWVELEGPLETDDERSRRAGVLPPQDADAHTVAEHLRRFAERAWRRPVRTEELDVYMKAWQSELDAGEKPRDAFRAALLGVLTSRHFIYLVEGDAAPREQLNDWELASRLSYFLWSSMPDAALFAAAEKGSLRGAGLEQEVDRLLADGRISGFLDDFPRQWLQLHRVGMFPPDKLLYPRYDRWLETCMRQEVVAYFREMFTNNMPLDGFIDSDWTMANPRLCNFYGIPEPKSARFERVALRPEDHRGGVLAMSAILGLTSDGTRHRPVHRGVWISEAIFNKTPPPPPANVAAIEPNPPESPKATIRQKLEAHRADAGCAACHRNIDPLGLAWDQYDAIGQWRTHEKVAQGVGDDPPIDPSGVMPDGERFDDVQQFKRLLLADRDKFLRAFIEHVSTYALRRVLTVDDEDDLELIVEEVRKKPDYGVRDIVRAVALSELIRKR